MPVSPSLRTASYLLRLTPEEKSRLEALAADREITLADALREGAASYLEDGRRHVAARRTRRRRSDASVG